MTSSELYMPSSGELRFSGPIPLGSTAAFPAYGSERPSTNSSRFGRRSHNSFFVRHAPHPKVVRHIKGLLDIPICAVNDVGFFKGRKDAAQFPPDNYNQKKLDYFSRYHDLPSNSININTQSYPINTITGLQYFLGKPMNMRVYRERFRPNMGLAEPPEAWREELRTLMKGVGFEKDGQPQPEVQPQPVQIAKTPATARPPSTGRPQTQSKYSDATGRLMPPPSRAMSRGFSRQGQKRDQFLGQMQADLNLNDAVETEAMVISILCQILQTDDVSAVKSWLVNAGDQEKNMVTDMLKSALGNKEDYYKRDNPEVYPLAPPPREPVIQETHSAHKVDRLSLDGDGQQRTSEGLDTTTYRYNPKPHRLPPLEEYGAEDTERPVTTEPFRQSSKKRSASRLATPKPDQSANEPQHRLRYTVSQPANAMTTDENKSVEVEPATEQATE